MSDEVGLQLVKQLKHLNRWITFFGSIVIVVMLLIGFILFKIVSFVQVVGTKVDDAKDSLNVQKQACEGDSAIANFLRKNNMCN